MIIKNEIELHQKSVEYIKETLGQYTEVDSLDTVENPIIHIYPIKDTYDKDGELDGYIDALFFEAHIYDTKNMKVCKSKKLHDGIMPFADLFIPQIKVFKDLSTMIVLHGKYNIGRYTAMSIGKVN
jgi:hypothetical protein